MIDPVRQQFLPGTACFQGRIPDGADDAELEDIALHDEETFRDACNLFNRLVKDYARKSGYCVSNRSGTNCKVYGVLGGKANADRKM